MRASRYGVPCKGSKSKLAEDIVNALPNGNRLVDICGGGFAISHCALLSKKWGKVLYNDRDSTWLPYLNDVMDGKYLPDIYDPPFIERTEFANKRDKDAFIKWNWSFSCNGEDYAFSYNTEDWKKAIHEYIVNGRYESFIKGTLPDIAEYVKAKDWVSRRAEFNNCVTVHKKELKNLSAMRCEGLERIESLQSLAGIGDLRNNLEMTTMDYRKYQYQPGDIVYCDISKDNLDDFFDFVHWATEQRFPVYFSMYDFVMPIWHRDASTVRRNGGGKIHRMDVIYKA